MRLHARSWSEQWAQLRRHNVGLDDRIVVTLPYAYTLPARGYFRDVLAYGRASLGLRIEDERGGGWWKRRGYLRVTGPLGRVDTFMRVLERLEHDLGGSEGGG